MVGLVVGCGSSGAPLGLCVVLAIGRRRRSCRRWARSRGRCGRGILRDEDPDLLEDGARPGGRADRVVFTSGRCWSPASPRSAIPALALAAVPRPAAAGLMLFMLQPPVRTWVISEHAGAMACSARCAPRASARSCCVTLPMGFCFGAMEVTLPAFGEDHGARGCAACWSPSGRWAAPRAASGTAPARGPTSRARRYARLAALLPIGYLPLALAPSVPAWRRWRCWPGLCIAPTLTAGNQIAGTVAPEGAETEAYTWPITALVVGLAIGNWAAGAIVEAVGLARGVPGQRRRRRLAARAGRGAAPHAGPRRGRAYAACSGRRPWPTRAGGRGGRTRRRCGARRGGARAGRGARRAARRTARSGRGASSGSPRPTMRPASQCAPWIDPGTTCSSRQKTALRSPSGSATPEAVVGSTVRRRTSCTARGHGGSVAARRRPRQRLPAPWPNR